MKKVLPIFLILALFYTAAAATVDKSADVLKESTTFMEKHGFTEVDRVLRLGLIYVVYEHKELNLRGMLSMQFLNIEGDLIPEPVLCGLVFEDVEDARTHLFCTQDPKEFQRLVKKALLIERAKHGNFGKSL